MIGFIIALLSGALMSVQAQIKHFQYMKKNHLFHVGIHIRKHCLPEKDCSCDGIKRKKCSSNELNQGELRFNGVLPY